MTMQQINLYQEQFRPVRELFEGRNILLVLLLLALSMLGSVGYYQWRQQGLIANLSRLGLEEVRLAQELVELQRKYPPPVKDVELESQVTRLVNEMERKKQVLAIMEGKQIGNSTGFSTFLEGLAAARVGGVWLTGFGLQQGGADLVLEGRTADPALLPELMQALSQQEMLHNKSFRFFEVVREQDEAEAAEQGDKAAAAAKERSQKPSGPELLRFQIRTVPPAPVETATPAASPLLPPGIPALPGMPGAPTGKGAKGGAVAQGGP